MDLIPVLDLARGGAVQARAGRRSRYAPVESVLTPGVTGDAVALASAYRRTLRARECYVADLDAIQGAALQHALLRRVARAWAAEVLLDAGTSDPEGARTVLAAGASRVVVGLETLRAFRDLAGIVDAAGAERVVFSLDLRLGRGVLHPALQASGPAPGDPESLAARAVDSGVRTLLLLDVGRVGTGGGVDLPLVARLRRRFPLQRILAGGGVKGRADLERLRDAGCDGALVATAFHTGRLGAADVEAFTAPRSAAGQSRASTSR